jgi:hypothetical protein
VGGSGAKSGIGAHDVQQDIAIHGGDHLGLSGPRSSSMISSVERPSFRIPYSLSIASWGLACLVITKRPCSSLTSRTWPTRIPNRTRRGFGMVICPFSETVVFIPLWYAFLLERSNQSLVTTGAKGGVGVRYQVLGTGGHGSCWACRYQRGDAANSFYGGTSVGRASPARASACLRRHRLCSPEGLRSLHIALASPPRRCAEWLRSCEIIEFHTFRLRVFSYLQAKKSDFPNNFTASPPFRARPFSVFFRVEAAPPPARRSLEKE